MYNFESHKFYDVDINLYYLNSRYYNPEVGRFINADGLLGETNNIQSTNMYLYCVNNPIMNSDENGYKWKLSNIIKSVATIAIISSVVVAACVVGGPVLIGAAIGAVVGTAVGGAIGYNANGLDGAINGALIGAAAGAAVGAIAGYAYQFFSTAGKVATDSITVGKDMGRVGQAATELGSSQYGGMPGYRFFGKLFPKLGEIHNKMWLSKNIAAGKTVFDIGWGLNSVDTGCSYYRETVWMIEFAEKGIEFVRQVISGF